MIMNFYEYRRAALITGDKEFADSLLKFREKLYLS